MTCPRCGTAFANEGDGRHECSSEPITPTALRKLPTRFLEDHNDGKVDNAGYWERKHAEEAEGTNNDD